MVNPKDVAKLWDVPVVYVSLDPAVMAWDVFSLPPPVVVDIDLSVAVDMAAQIGRASCRERV